MITDKDNALSEEERVKALSSLISYCHSNLFTINGKKTLKYLMEERGFSEETIRKFKLGCFPEYPKIISNVIGTYAAWALKISWFDKETRNEESPFCINKVIIPYYDEFGVPLGIVGRSMLSSEEMKARQIPKYLNSYFDKRRHLFGLNFTKGRVRKKDRILLVEGNFDTIHAYQAGIKNVAGLGHATVTPSQFALACRYASNIELCLDNDDAGQKSMLKAIKVYGECGHTAISQKRLPKDFKDIDDYLKNSNKII